MTQILKSQRSSVFTIESHHREYFLRICAICQHAADKAIEGRLPNIAGRVTQNLFRLHKFSNISALV